jgi:hypothetical protein
MTTTFVFLGCKEMVFGDVKKRELKRPERGFSREIL